jgi:hypothetical protein
MASRKSPSSAQSASRADPTTRFRQALARAAQRGKGGLHEALVAALASAPAQRSAGALLRAADAAARVGRDGHRPDRLTAPAEALPPLP